MQKSWVVILAAFAVAIAIFVGMFVAKSNREKQYLAYQSLANNCLQLTETAVFEIVNKEERTYPEFTAALSKCAAEFSEMEKKTTLQPESATEMREMFQSLKLAEVKWKTVTDEFQFKLDKNRSEQEHIEHEMNMGRMDPLTAQDNLGKQIRELKSMDAKAVDRGRFPEIQKLLEDAENHRRKARDLLTMKR